MESGSSAESWALELGFVTSVLGCSVPFRFLSSKTESIGGKSACKPASSD